LHLVDDPIATLLQDGLGAVPGAARAGALEAPVVEAIEILEDAIFVREHHDRLFRDESPMGDLSAAAWRTFAGAPAAWAPASPNGGLWGCPAFFPASRAGSVSVVGPPLGAENCRAIWGPGLTALPVTRSSKILVKLSGVRSS